MADKTAPLTVRALAKLAYPHLPTRNMRFVECKKGAHTIRLPYTESYSPGAWGEYGTHDYRLDAFGYVSRKRMVKVWLSVGVYYTENVILWSDLIQQVPATR